MIHKIQTSNGGLVVLEVRQQKLYISKGSSILTFDVVQTNQLNAIIQSIDASKYVLKEYGSVKKGSEVFKISISEFRGIKSFQIRQREISNTYSGYGKLGISLPVYKIKELQMHMASVVQEFAEEKIS